MCIAGCTLFTLTLLPPVLPSLPLLMLLRSFELMLLRSFEFGTLVGFAICSFLQGSCQVIKGRLALQQPLQVVVHASKASMEQLGDVGKLYEAMDDVPGYLHHIFGWDCSCGVSLTLCHLHIFHVFG